MRFVPEFVVRRHGRCDYCECSRKQCRDPMIVTSYIERDESAGVKKTGDAHACQINDTPSIIDIPLPTHENASFDRQLFIFQ